MSVMHSGNRRPETGNHKGQALDFLMTYGWAVVLLILIGASLFSLGILDVGSFIGNRAAGFSEVSVPAFRVSPSGLLLLKLRNDAGRPIRINYINATYQNQTITAWCTNTRLGIGEVSNIIPVGNLTGISPDMRYAIAIKIGYEDRATGFAYASKGTVFGEVS
ncbi:MAG: hypothetical protein AB1657_04240 [Candidatus Micrarchaeota archaeon]